MILPETAKKHDLSGIGGVTASLVISLLAGSSLAFLTTGPLGWFVAVILRWLFSGLASMGLVLLNVGVAHVQTINEKKDFDGSFEDAFRAINAKNGELTDEEKAAIDQKVIDAFRKFATFGTNGSVRDGGDSGHYPSHNSSS